MADIDLLIQNAAGVGRRDLGALEVALGLFDTGLGRGDDGLSLGQLRFAKGERRGFGAVAQGSPVFQSLRGKGIFLFERGLRLGQGGLGDNQRGFIVTRIDRPQNLAFFEKSAALEFLRDADDSPGHFRYQRAFGPRAHNALGGHDDLIGGGFERTGFDVQLRGRRAPTTRLGFAVHQAPREVETAGNHNDGQDDSEWFHAVVFENSATSGF